VRPHRLIKGLSPKVCSFTPPITHVTESYDSIQRGFAPSSGLRATSRPYPSPPLLKKDQNVVTSKAVHVRAEASTPS
jgi:hypothetical protein